MAWGFDFAAARNRCRELATGDWILWLDAGERLQGNSASELREFIDQQADSTKVYMLMVEVPPVDPGGFGEQTVQLRLMPNCPELRFTGRVRETLDTSLESAGLQADAVEMRILRHPRQHEPARKMSRAQRDLELVALETATTSPLPARFLLAEGNAYADLGDFENARNTFRKAIDASEKGSAEMLGGYYGLLAAFDADPFLRDVQLSTSVEALEFFPLDAQLLMASGNYLYAKNSIELAIRCYRIAYQYGQVDLETWHLSEIAVLTANGLSLALQTQGQDDEAQTVLEESLECHHDSLPLRRNLINLHIRHGREEQAIDSADPIPLPVDHREPLRDAIRGACKAAVKDWTPALGFLQSAYVAGCRDPICLRWLAVTLLSNGQTEAAKPVLHEWQRIEPASVELHAYLAAVEQEATAGQAGSETASVDTDLEPIERHLRVDQGAITLEAASPTFPIVSQTTSIDSTAQPEV